MASRKGIPNKASASREKAHERVGITPLMYMLKILRDETQVHDERMKAAVAAAPYVHPKLAAVTLDGSLDVGLHAWLVAAEKAKEPKGD